MKTAGGCAPVDRLRPLLSPCAMRPLPLMIFVFLLHGALAVHSVKQDIEVVSCSLGKDCFLPCFYKQFYEIIWEYERVPIVLYSTTETFNQHSLFINRTSLKHTNGECSVTIRDMKLQESGIYKCHLETQSGRLVKRYNVTVHAPVEKVSIERVGDVMICSSENISPKPECRWSDAVTNSSLSLHQDLYSINCTTPVLHNVSEYTCTVSTPHSAKSATYRQLPSITFSWTETTLSCNTSSGLTNGVIWKSNNSEIIVNQSREVSKRWRPFVKDVSESGTLILKNLKYDHQGLFTCVHSTDTETYSGNVFLEKMDFSNWTLIASIIVTLLMTATILLMFKRSQVTSDTQSTESQARLPQRPSSAEDGFNFVLHICRFLGLGPLFSHHYLLMTLLYFQHHVNFIDSNWIFSLIVLISEAAQLLSVGINSYFTPRFTLQKHIMSCLILMSCLLFVLAIVSGTAQLAGETLMGICICVLWLISLFSAMVESHLSENINMFPSEHRRSFEQGQASARTVASVLMVVFLFIPLDVALHIACHFALAVFVSLLTLIAYVILIHLDFAKKYFNQNVTCTSELQDLNDRKNDNASEDPESPDGNTSNCLKNCLRFLGIMIVQTLTFTVYPAITADVHTKYPGGAWERFFTPLCCFLNFNLISCISIPIGQKMPFQYQAQKHFLVVFPILVSIYTGFIPMVLFCNVQPRTFHYIAFQFDDTAFIFIMLFFSFSNAYLMHLTLQYFQNHNDRANTIVRALGSVIGALLSFGFRAAI